MITKETQKEFNEAFMNNGVNGVLDNKFQEPKMLFIKAFISTHFTDNRVIASILDKEIDKHKHECVQTSPILQDIKRLLLTKQQ